MYERQPLCCSPLASLRLTIVSLYSSNRRAPEAPVVGDLNALPGASVSVGEPRGSINVSRIGVTLIPRRTLPSYLGIPSIPLIIRFENLQFSSLNLRDLIADTAAPQ